jgi:hypothetical protein
MPGRLRRQPEQRAFVPAAAFSSDKSRERLRRGWADSRGVCRTGGLGEGGGYDCEEATEEEEAKSHD